MKNERGTNVVGILCSRFRVRRGQNLLRQLRNPNLSWQKTRNRIEAAEQPLFWSYTLAAGAQEWAVHLAGEVHSPSA